MGAEGPSIDYQLPPCPNCGHLRPDRKAWRGNSGWGHGLMVCSNACGLRLAKKIEAGMMPRPTGMFGSPFNSDAARIADLRNEIRMLNYQIDVLTGRRPEPESEVTDG